MMGRSADGPPLESLFKSDRLLKGHDKLYRGDFLRIFQASEIGLDPINDQSEVCRHSIDNQMVNE